jgi:quinoprotein glucose dehydrogenase
MNQATTAFALTAIVIRSWFGQQNPLALAAQTPASKTSTVDWPAYNGQTNGDHYSPLTQINIENVRHLKVAWTFDTHETGGLQTNPLVIGRTLYGFTPTQKGDSFS